MAQRHRLDMLTLDFYEGMTIHPTLLCDGEMAVLIDTGCPGQVEELRAAMMKVGVTFDMLRAVILTHQDVDHIGCLPEIIRECGEHITVFAHSLEKPYIEGELPLLKDAELEHQPIGRVDETVEDGQELSFCGGIRVIHTPGHTPGHISLYVKQHHLLVAGDSMYSVNGKLGGVHPPSTLDVEEAQRSLQKYSDFAIDAVICYHGGLASSEIQEQLQAFY
ncbi:MBL fold metallo-hydrolase [Brevibacillus fluminis]|uniref:MBL fold metallo-hydrolase n=1 Tax=Brevibacillus fluminis TaxID=511487 RepID=A0A3M8DR75_9BACL|nr:MBL fold metallo-hydrolase [Brevibacillus fluminis]RNB89497.1 MBL fold metallo-hydrolase [Brevibacillus fluminis]